MATVRLNIHVEEDVPDLLAELAGSQKKMGAYLTGLVRSVHRSQVEVGKPGDVEVLSNAVSHLALKVREIESRLAQLRPEREEYKVRFSDQEGTGTP